jgi:hypothetical protein
MLRFIFISSLILFHTTFLYSQRLVVSPNNRYLTTENGDPFFWMADTAWELLHRCNEEEVDMYLEKRAAQGFNVVQAVILAELDGLNAPNPYGERPLLDNDPTRPNPRYFEHVDYVVQKAKELGIYMALLPTWGDKVFKNSWGTGPEIFNITNARIFGKWVGERYKDYDNIVWVIGGDRNPREGSDDVAIWNTMAEGLAEGAGGYDKTLMTFHPQPRKGGGSSEWFHEEEWLDFNMHQTGHCANQGTYEHIRHDYNLLPIKPVLDGEPLYEEHPNCFIAKDLGYSVADDIRRIMYWNIFAGAFGQTYGCHDVWQMYKLDKTPINQPLRPWPEALDLPMANQVRHLKNLMLSRPFLSRIPDQSLVLDEQVDNENYVIATRDIDGSYAMVYFPTGSARKLDFSKIKGEKLTSWWYDTRTGIAFSGPELMNSKSERVEPPSSGKGNDWVLVVDAAESGFSEPGKVSQ